MIVPDYDAAGNYIGWHDDASHRPVRAPAAGTPSPAAVQLAVRARLERLKWEQLLRMVRP
jgi:hypothetical protein